MCVVSPKESLQSQERSQILKHLNLLILGTMKTQSSLIQGRVSDWVLSGALAVSFPCCLILVFQFLSVDLLPLDCNSLYVFIFTDPQQEDGGTSFPMVCLPISRNNCVCIRILGS